MKDAKTLSTKLVLTNELILNQIYYIRSQKVLLDKDLAKLYRVETRNLNKAVRRNIKRFPADFMFQLTADEVKNLMFQTGTSSWGGNRKFPYAFTEQGVAMLSGVLNSERAVMVNVQIMRVFTEVRKMLFDNTELRLAIEKIKRKTENNTKNIEVVFRYFDEFVAAKEKEQRKIKKRQPIGFKLPKAAKKRAVRRKYISMK